MNVSCNRGSSLLSRSPPRPRLRSSILATMAMAQLIFLAYGAWKISPPLLGAQSNRDEHGQPTEPYRSGPDPVSHRRARRGGRADRRRLLDFRDLAGLEANAGCHARRLHWQALHSSRPDRDVNATSRPRPMYRGGAAHRRGLCRAGDAGVMASMAGCSTFRIAGAESLLGAE